MKGLRHSLIVGGGSHTFTTEGRIGRGPIVTHPVAQVRLLTDAVQENVILTLAAPSGEQMTFELPPHVAKYIADEIPGLLREMGARNPQRPQHPNIR